MFYPVDSLRRGGRFYLCWVADSWPIRFLHVTQRQLWSQDIRVLCDDLLEVIKNESGRRTNRFSLRLSSQLMRGLVRIYQKKATILIGGELCMLNANVFKHSNKKWNQKENTREHRVTTKTPVIQVTVPLETENEQRVEELIQNSGNIVSNIQEITLKESLIPEIQVPNDGFGEENAIQQLQQLTDMSVEMMLVQDPSVAQHSGLDLLALDVTEKSHDKSRMLLDRPMERISELDMTLFRKSTAADLAPPIDLEKDIPEIPEIPLIPPPEMPIPEPEKQVGQPAQQSPAAPEHQQPQPEELEELEELQPQQKRRRVKKLIIDKRTKLSSEFLRARIDNVNVELRCEDFSDDIIEIRVPPSELFRQPCHSGSNRILTINWTLAGLFERNLEIVPRSISAERDIEEAMNRMAKRKESRHGLPRIAENEELIIPELPPMEKELQMPEELNMEANVSKDLTNVTAPRMTAGPAGGEDLPTQPLETLSQRAKRAHEEDVSEAPKRPRLGCLSYSSFRRSQELAKQTEEQNPTEAKRKHKEIPELKMTDAPEAPAPALGERSPEKNVAAMLRSSGLADVSVGEASRGKRQRSDGSETPLGSLDRTKVSLGDSTKTTDSQRFIRDEWGTEGTMLKIYNAVSDNQRAAVASLVAGGPTLPGLTRVIAARCFTSILKLKQHGFVTVAKHPDTLEIVDIQLGPRFE